MPSSFTLFCPSSAFWFTCIQLLFAWHFVSKFLTFLSLYTHTQTHTHTFTLRIRVVHTCSHVCMPICIHVCMCCCCCCCSCCFADTLLLTLCLFCLLYSTLYTCNIYVCGMLQSSVQLIKLFKLKAYFEYLHSKNIYLHLFKLCSTRISFEILSFKSSLFWLRFWNPLINIFFLLQL